MKLEIITSLQGINVSGLKAAVADFVNTNNQIQAPLNKEGFFTQIIESIVTRTEGKAAGQYFWAALDEDKNPTGWALTHIAKDVDNQLCYWMTCAWVRKDYRRTPLVKEWLQTMRTHAVQLCCKHVIIPSSRHIKPYLRMLGKAWHVYSVLLKEDI